MWPVSLSTMLLMLVISRSTCVWMDSIGVNPGLLCVFPRGIMVLLSGLAGAARATVAVLRWIGRGTRMGTLALLTGITGPCWFLKVRLSFANNKGYPT